MTHDDIMATASHYSEVDRTGYVRFTEDDLINFANAIIEARETSANVAQGSLTDEQKSAVTQAADVMGANGFNWVEETLRKIVSANVAQGAETIYQAGNENGHVWRDVTKLDYERCSENKRIVYAAPPAQTALTDDARLIDLFDVLMRQNIETSDESYLSLKCVGVPPTKVEFVAAVQCALTAAQSASGETK